MFNFAKKLNPSMKKIASVLFALCLGISAMAQKPLTASEAEKVEAGIEAQTSKIATIRSDFKQTKHVSGMTRDLVSNGDMMYKKERKVVLNYTTPLKYKMVLNGDKVKMENGGKSKVYSANGNASMNEMQNMISACMTGNMKALKKDYKMSYFDNGDFYLVKIVPVSTQKKLFKEIEMEIRKSDKMLYRLRLTETIKSGKTENDYTEYVFSNTVPNTPLADTLFKID